MAVGEHRHGGRRVFFLLSALALGSRLSALAARHHGKSEQQLIDSWPSARHGEAHLIGNAQRERRETRHERRENEGPLFAGETSTTTRTTTTRTTTSKTTRMTTKQGASAGKRDALSRSCTLARSLAHSLTRPFPLSLGRRAQRERCGDKGSGRASERAKRAKKVIE